MFLIYFIVMTFFELMRSLFFAYIVKRLLRNDVYGLYSIIIYFVIKTFNDSQPVFLLRSVVMNLVLLLISAFIYSVVFKLFNIPVKSKLKSPSLDIYTISYDHRILYILSSILIMSFLLFRLVSGQSRPVITLVVMILIISYVIFIKKRDQHATSHIIMRLGKEAYSYQVKAINPKIKTYRYHEFFKSDMYQLDIIAKVIYKKEGILRYDYIYALKSYVTAEFEGFETRDIPYKDVLDSLKHYQLVKIHITNTQSSVKRIK